MYSIFHLTDAILNLFQDLVEGFSLIYLYETCKFVWLVLVLYAYTTVSGQ